MDGDLTLVKDRQREHLMFLGGLEITEKASKNGASALGMGFTTHRPTQYDNTGEDAGGETSTAPIDNGTKSTPFPFFLDKTKYPCLITAGPLNARFEDHPFSSKLLVALIALQVVLIAVARIVVDYIYNSLAKWDFKSRNNKIMLSGGSISYTKTVDWTQTVREEDEVDLHGFDGGDDGNVRYHDEGDSTWCSCLQVKQALLTCCLCIHCKKRERNDNKVYKIY
jgi:hypothetical protein